MKTVFANVLKVRASQTELVLEFGCFFPDMPNQFPPSNYEPDVRVVMNIMTVQALIKALQNLPQATEAVTPQVRQPVGFQKPTG